MSIDYVCRLPVFVFYITFILQGYFTGIGAIISLPQCQWSNPEEYVKMYDIKYLWAYNINTKNKH